jgi:hypothetical protein
MRTLSDNSSVYLFRNFTKNQGAAIHRPDFSEVVKVDTSAVRYLSMPIWLHQAPTEWNIQLQGSAHPSGPWSNLGIPVRTSSAGVQFPAGATYYEMGGNGDPALSAGSEIRPTEFVRVRISSLAPQAAESFTRRIYLPEGTGSDGGYYHPGTQATRDYFEVAIDLPPGLPPKGGWPVWLFSQNQGGQQFPAAGGDFDNDSPLAAVAGNENGTQWMRHAAIRAGWAVVRVGLTGTNTTGLGSNDIGVWRAEYDPRFANITGAQTNNHKAVRDLQFAIQAIRHHFAPDYGLNGDQIVVAGPSGGGLAAMASAFMFDRRDLTSEDPMLHESSRPNGVFFHNVVSYWVAYDDAMNLPFFEGYTIAGDLANPVGNLASGTGAVNASIAAAAFAERIACSPIYFIQAASDQTLGLLDYLDLAATNYEFGKRRALALPIYLSSGTENITPAEANAKRVWFGDGVEFPVIETGGPGEDNHLFDSSHPVWHALLLKDLFERMYQRTGIKGRCELNMRDAAYNNLTDENKKLVTRRNNTLKATVEDALSFFEEQFRVSGLVRTTERREPRVTVALRGHSEVPALAGP